MSTPHATDATPPTPAAGRDGITAGLLLVLALLSALAPFATDLYLPAFPTMAAELATDATSIQLTLTAFLIGIAAGQLVFGPLSDRVGRVKPLVIGSVLCVVASVAAAAAPTIEILVGARLVQGLAGAAGMVIGRAVISDLSRGTSAARAFSLMMLVGGIAPVLAPLLGSMLVGPVGWRGLLWIVAVLALAMLVGVLAVVRETHPAARRAEMREQRARTGSGARELRSRDYLGNTLAFGFAFAVMMAYISASPFVYQVMMGLSEVQYGLAFGANALGLALVSGISARLAATRSVPGLLGLGLTLVLLSAVAVLVLALSPAPAGWLALPLFTSVASLGLVLGNATALALAAARHTAGTASAVLGALQFALAGLVSPLVSLGGEDTAVPLAGIMTALAVIALGCFAVGRRGCGRLDVAHQLEV